VARTPRPPAPVTWRDGVHLTGTPIWCDARRRRDVCFVSSADRLTRGQSHGQLIGTPATLALVGGGDGHLAVPVRRPFTLGTLRLELIPSGRGLGAAALYVESRARTWLYAGAVRTTGAAEPAEVRACDAVVVAAPIGEREHTVPTVDAATEQLVAWVRAQLAAGARPIVVVDTVLDGIEIVAQLDAAGVAATASRSLREATGVPGAPELRAPGRDPAVHVRVETDRSRADLRIGPGRAPVNALVSLRALEPPDRSLHATKFALRLAWPFAATRAQLLAWIEQTKARDVFVTGACAETIVAALGNRARVLGPPHQMTLFPREAMR
jgi:hypothetical protein